MKIYLVRHGQTLFNLKHRIQGWCDSPLTENGIQQAKALHNSLSTIDFVAAYSSTSERTVDTLNYILGEREVIRTPLKGLKEMNFGTLEGEFEKEVLANDGSSHEKGFVEFGGETIAMTSKRLVDTLTGIAKQHSEGNVLVVSHGGAIMSALLGIEEERIQEHRRQGNHIGNCSVTILNYDGNFTIETISDMSYVEEGMKGE